MRRTAWAITPGLNAGGGRRFFYPRKGFGQLCHAMAGEIERLGGEIRLSTVVKEIFLKNNCPARILARSQESTAGDDEIPVDFLFSTIPITGLVNCVRPKPPPEVIATSERMRYRSMVLSYLVLATDRFSPYDAHYFPGTDTVFSRLSEPKNYSDTKEPLGLTGLCVEIPCWAGDEIWNASERAVFSLTMKNMARAGMPVRYPVRAIFVRRIRHAYPAYDLDYEARVGIIEEYLSGVPHLISLGRQGLFAHDNTHHSMEMAYRAGECLEQGLVWNSERWKFYREEFDRHVVED
jgi:protoporphyrinogen oxidase